MQKPKSNPQRLLILIAIAGGLYLVSKGCGLMSDKASAPPAVVASPVPTPSPRPVIPPAMSALGEKVAERVDADITAWGTGVPGTYVMVLLPEQSWKALSKTEKAALTYYAEASVATVRANAESHVGVSPSAPAYEKSLLRTKTICPDCWVVTVGRSPTKPYGVDRNVVIGDGVSMNGSFADRASKFRAKMLAPAK